MTTPQTDTPQAEHVSDTEVVVMSATKGEIERREPASSAVEAAAQAAVEMPGVPGRDEFLALAMQARMLSLSGAAPEAIRKDPYVAFHVAMVGRDLGISPSAAIELIDVIQTRNGPRLSLSPQLLNGQIRRLGLGSIRPVVQERDRCVAQALGPNDEPLGPPTEFTWEDARDAELVGPNCQPGAHVKDQNRSSNGRTWKVCGCNQGYVTYPKRMMWWRAAGFCADDYFPEAGLGLYSPEELGALVDDEGRPVDPSQVALPEGYPEPRQVATGPDDSPADPAALWALQERIQALPDKLRSDLAAAWKSDESRVRGHRAATLPARLLKIAQAMVNGFEAQAKSAGVDMAAELVAVRRDVSNRHLEAMIWAPIPRMATSHATQPASGGDTPEQPSENAQTDSGGQSDEPGEPPRTVDADGVDWSAEMRSLAQRVRDLGPQLPADVVTNIVGDVKGLHHAKVNQQLGDAGIPADGPIDMRRMHLSLQKMREWLADNGQGPSVGPCQHGKANGYCVVFGCPHAEEPF